MRAPAHPQIPVTRVVANGKGPTARAAGTTRLDAGRYGSVVHGLAARTRFLGVPPFRTTRRTGIWREGAESAGVGVKGGFAGNRDPEWVRSSHD